jgi:DNA-binding NarL/FixJ family response regulator
MTAGLTRLATPGSVLVGSDARAGGVLPDRLIHAWVVDARPIGRAALAALLASFEGVRSTGADSASPPVAADDAAEVVLYVAHADGEHWVGELRDLVEAPNPRVIVMLVHDRDANQIRTAFAAGAAAVVDAGSDVAELEAAIRAVAAGRQYADPTLAAEVIAGALDPHSPGRSLSDRETEVLRLVALGKSNREMAETLHISVRTVEAHRLHVMRKIGAHTPEELKQFARARGLIRSPP